jgi:hypothetical protein
MANSQTSQQATAEQPQPAAGAGPPLDVNAETYPFDYVQYLLEQTANFNLFSVPERHHPEDLLLTPDPKDWFSINGGYGIVIRSELRRFDSFVPTPSTDEVTASQAVGETVGSLKARWVFCPDKCKWSPGQLPTPALYDPWNPQRFSMVDGDFSFGGSDRFRGYGVGCTYPINAGGQPRLLAAVVGNLMEGEGKFRGREGSFVMTGTVTSSVGFVGQISLRVVDPDGVLRTERELPAMTAIADPDPSSTFIIMRGEKKDRSVRTEFGPSPGGGLSSLITPSQFRAAHFNVARRGGGGVRTETTIGPVVCKMDATVYFNLSTPPGTANAPVPFSTDEIYTVIDSRGRTAATLTAKVEEGISFNLKFPAAPGQPGVRFAGFGPITGGTGPLEGVQGILTVNSLIGIAPHALTLMHVLHLVDPGGQHRSSRHLR